MKDVIIKCEKGEVKKTLAYIERKRSNVRWVSGDKPTGYGGMAEHERNHRPLAYIEEIGGLSYNKCYLIEVKGLEKV